MNISSEIIIASLTLIRPCVLLDNKSRTSAHDDGCIVDEHGSCATRLNSEVDVLLTRKGGRME